MKDSPRIFTSPGTTRVYLLRNELVQCELQIWCHCPQPWNINLWHNKLLSFACTILGDPLWRAGITYVVQDFGDQYWDKTGLLDRQRRRALDRLGLKLGEEIAERWPKDGAHEVKISWCKKNEAPAWSEFIPEEDVTRRVERRQRNG